MNAASREFEANNKEGRRVGDAKRAAAQGGSRFGYNLQLKRMLHDKQGGVCPCCFEAIVSLEQSEVDHKRPLPRGGPDDSSNRMLAHAKCSRMKHNNTLEEHLERRVAVRLDVENLGRKHGLIE